MKETNRYPQLGFLLAALAAILLVIPFRSLPVRAQSQSNTLAWPEITQLSKPWTRWWWLGNIAEPQQLTEEIERYKKAGIGGLELTPIYGVQGYEDHFIDFLSPKWMDLFEHTLKEADRLDMGLDMATGTGWPFGGPWIGYDDACRNFVHQTYLLKGGERLREPIQHVQKPLVRPVRGQVRISELKDPISANENLQALAIDQVRFPKPLPLQALMAYSDKGKTFNLTDKVDQNGTLNWIAPEGSWTLYALFQGWHGKMVERAAPGGEGNVIDHFSAQALGNYLRKFDEAFQGRNIKSLRAFFNDSYEVDDGEGDSNWTPDFFDQFQKRRGYDLRDHLPALVGKDSPDKNRRVLYDFRETISDLLLEEFTIPWREWATNKGAIIRNQAHGSPANILDLYAASHIPETEGTDIVRMKFASSAANVTGKPITAAEAATWLNEHFISTLADVKYAADQYFLGGVNHIVYHGTPFSPASEEWPGRLFYAAVHFGPSNSFWNDFPTLNSYIARTQSFLQEGRPDNDVLLYYAIHDMWSEPGKSTLVHVGGGHDVGITQKDAQLMLDAGYAYDLISDRQLADVSFSGTSLRTGNLPYQVIVLPELRLMPLNSFAKLMDLARSGATVIVHRNLPADIPGLGGLESRHAEFKKLVGQLDFSQADSAGVRSAKVGKGRFLLGEDLKQLLASARVRRESMADQNVQFLRRTYEGGHHYFVVNRSDKPIDGWVPIHQDGKTVAIFDPMRAVAGIADVRSSTTGGREVYLQLAPGESLILRTFATVVKGPSFTYTTISGTPQTVGGTWSVRFVEGGPELPTARETTQLGSWTNFGGEAVKSFSGTATYTISLARPAEGKGDWILDLGRVAESARVTFNGTDLGTLIAPPYRIRIPASLWRDKNTLEIAVSNLMANRIADLERRRVTWKKFYNINFPSRLPENRGEDGLFTASRWPPKDSGLIGPVTLSSATDRRASP